MGPFNFLPHLFVVIIFGLLITPGTFDACRSPSWAPSNLNFRGQDLLTLYFVPSALSTTHYVAIGGSGTICTSSSPCPSIQAAINAATSGDSISIGAGTFTGTDNYALTFPSGITLNIFGSGQGVSVVDIQQLGTHCDPPSYCCHLSVGLTRPALVSFRSICTN